MIKKTTLLSIVFALCTLPASAQYMGPSDILTAKSQYDMLPQAQRNAMDDHLTRAIYRRIHRATDPVCQWAEDTYFRTCGGSFTYDFQTFYKTTDWISLVRSEERTVDRNGPLGSSCYAVTTPSFEQKPLHRDVSVYQDRFNRLQAAITKNPVLKKYKLSVPNPDDLVIFDQDKTTPWNFKSVLKWFAWDTSRPHLVECSRQVPGVIGISFTHATPQIQVAFNLWIDTQTKTVYFLRNGKYYGETFQK